MNTVVIGIGSNIKPRANIRHAIKYLAQDLKFIKESSFKITKPLGLKDQSVFTNGAIWAHTSLGQSQLKSRLKKIENSLGRKRVRKNFGPRTVDLDILVWNNRVVHDDFFERDFVRDSVLELLPHLKNEHKT